MAACTKEIPFLIVTELIEPGSLANMLRANRQNQALLPLADVKRLSCHILIALVYLHALKFVHRDLKPGNILISGEGKYSRAKIAGKYFAPPPLHRHPFPSKRLLSLTFYLLRADFGSSFGLLG